VCADSHGLEGKDGTRRDCSHRARASEDKEKGFDLRRKMFVIQGFLGTLVMSVSTVDWCTPVQDLTPQQARTKHPEPPGSPIHATHHNHSHSHNPLKMIMPHSMQAQPLKGESGVD
jgi:hypothetical protein